MAKYTVRVSNKAQKQLDNLPLQIANVILESLEVLSDNPRPHGCKKLKARQGYRIRVGNYRIIYEIFDDVLVVKVINLGHRKDVYD